MPHSTKIKFIYILPAWSCQLYPASTDLYRYQPCTELNMVWQVEKHGDDQNGEDDEEGDGGCDEPGSPRRAQKKGFGVLSHDVCLG